MTNLYKLLFVVVLFGLFPNISNAFFTQQQYGDRKGTAYWQGNTDTNATEITVTLQNSNTTHVRGYELNIYRVASTSSEISGKVASATYTGNLTQGVMQAIEFTLDSPFTLQWTSDYEIEILTLMESGYTFAGNVYVKEDSSGNSDFKYIVEFDDWDDTEPQTVNGVYRFTIGSRPWIFFSGIGEGNYVTLTSPCAGDSRNNVSTKCETAYDVVFDVGGVVHTVDNNLKLEILFKDVNNNTLDSVALLYASSGTYTFTQEFTWALSSTTYNITACVLPEDGFAFFGNGECTTVLWGNGVAPFDIWDSYGTSTIEDAWTENGCDDLGITDVFKGVKCAFIWGFSPNVASINKFNEAKNSVLTLYPIGYATLILTDVRTAFNSTSTTAFDRDIDVKKFFGQTGGTTTISVSNLTSELGMVEPIINYGEIILWSLFVGWLLVWGLTRKL
jgi:hypothetical protein